MIITENNMSTVAQGIQGITDRIEDGFKHPNDLSRLGDLDKAEEFLIALNNLNGFKEEHNDLYKEAEMGFRVKGRLERMSRFLDGKRAMVSGLSFAVLILNNK